MVIYVRGLDRWYGDCNTVKQSTASRLQVEDELKEEKASWLKTILICAGRESWS